MTVVRTDRARLMRGLRLFCVGLIALFAGCGGNTIIIYGTAVISVQSTNTQFLSYQVAIDSIVLTRSDGIVVEPLSTPETVDFAQITNIAELLGSPALPIGSYVSVSITLDYTEASIWVDQGGRAVTVAAVDTSGALMSTAVITITLDPNNPLVITSQQSSRLALNLNLGALNTLETASSEVVVQPFMYATPAAVDSTPMRARGLYVTEMSVANGFIMNARPFIDQVSALGAETVNTTAQTYFNINGIVYFGSAGLAEIAEQPENTLVVAYGTLDNLSGITPTFNATSVYVGLIVQSPLDDNISGVVTARSGNTLTVSAGTFFSILDLTEFYPTSTVTVAPATLVEIDGSATTGLTADAVSVGQQVQIFGQATVSATNTLSIDATAGYIRLQSTRLWGTLNSATPGSATLNMLTLQNFVPAGLSFAGTGATAAQDATAANYVVNTGTIDESATAPGTLLQVDGLVSAFGTAPPDFTATAVTLGSATPQVLVVEWASTGATAPFTSTDYSAGLTVNLKSTNISATHYIATGPSQVDLTSLPSSPQITYAPTNLQLAVGIPTTGSVVGTEASVTLSNSVANFASAMATAFNGTNTIYSLVAVGQYDSATNTFNATQINVNLLTP
jgi:hypothetical protein